METINKELDTVTIHKTKGAFIRSKTKWYDEGEKCNKLFLSLEKNQMCNKTIKHLKTANGDIYNINQILQEEKLYFERLYSENTDIDGLQFNKICYYSKTYTDIQKTFCVNIFCAGIGEL